MFMSKTECPMQRQRDVVNERRDSCRSKFFSAMGSTIKEEEV